ncbi:hypothetical protein IPM09_01695 [Candidatus Saccharibacteria bacterium]|nr:MAG: hypothetical protein IPM09_01695 [Candidatus Saccharibacteria bacterium]
MPTIDKAKNNLTRWNQLQADVATAQRAVDAAASAVARATHAGRGDKVVDALLDKLEQAEKRLAAAAREADAFHDVGIGAEVYVRLNTAA